MSKWQVKYQCSNCARHFESTPFLGMAEALFADGNRAVGDAFYCSECVRSWPERNGKPFDTQYGKENAGHMFANWWNRETERQAPVGTKISVSKHLPNGDYYVDREFVKEEAKA